MASNTPTVDIPLGLEPIVPENLRVEVIDLETRVVNIRFRTMKCGDEKALGRVSTSLSLSLSLSSILELSYMVICVFLAQVNMVENRIHSFRFRVDHIVSRFQVHGSIVPAHGGI